MYIALRGSEYFSGWVRWGFLGTEEVGLWNGYNELMKYALFWLVLREREE